MAGTSPTFPIIDVLRESFGIEDGETEADIVRKVDAGAHAMGGELRQSVPYLKFVLWVDTGDAGVTALDPRMRKARIFEALRALTVAGPWIAPVVQVFEDVHWADRLSEELIAYLADAASRLRLLLLLTHRPGYGLSLRGQTISTQLVLTSLSERQSSELAVRTLGTDSLPDELQRIIADKAEGNPFFIEEVLRSLLEAGAIYPWAPASAWRDQSPRSMCRTRSRTSSWRGSTGS